MLNLKEIKKDYLTSSETVHALKGVSIAFRKSEFVSILGPSGCGKTTLLNIIGGLDHYTDGDLVINGRSTKSYQDRDWDVYRNHRIGFIFQSYNLIPHQTVLGNVELALTIAGISREERIARAKKALDRVGLSNQYYKKPNQLSGGQCQRVAIARALVNDPEILLADEPTGALDTVTSVQIMDLIKEISGERLVIMVTHNPELAEKYSSRIIRLLDGNVIEDTAPFSSEEEEAECAALRTEEETEKEQSAAELPDGRKSEKPKKKKEKAKMSFFTAFMLSAKNLLSKKGRTAMVGFAGSIGIIGIAMVLAFSSGIKGFIASMQDDMLSGNPISITENAYDLDALTGMMNSAQKEEIVKQPNRVYISSLVEYLASMNSDMKNTMVENTITEDYVRYVMSMPEEYYNAMLLGYGIDMNNNVYTEFKASADSEAVSMSVTALTAMYTALLNETEFSDYAAYVTALAPSMAEMPNNADYILSQYDLVGEGSKLADGKGEIMLVLDSKDELSDLLLARFGYYTQDEFLEIVKKATSEDGSYDEELYRDSFAYDELIGKELVWYPNDTVFDKIEYTNPITSEVIATTYGYSAYSSDFTDEELDGGVKLTVVGILTPKENINYGSITSGIYYTEALTEHVLSTNADSEIFSYINGIDESSTDAAAMYSYYIPYSYTYNYQGETKNATGAVGPSNSMADMMSSMMGSSSVFDHKATKEKLIRNLGGNSLANEIYIYPVSFDDKNLVTDYLDKWNENTSLTYTDYSGAEVTVNLGDGSDITYTDTLELIINIINTMIDVISYALIAFTSISLVVSTVMIGIITYVSVVERIKEIGVIRALGGRKKDVRHLFNAETFIIGLLAGIIGVGATYLISLIVNAILKPLIGYSSIAALPLSNAIILIVISVLLTLVSGLIPASSAAKKDPVVALRTE